MTVPPTTTRIRSSTGLDPGRPRVVPHRLLAGTRDDGLDARRAPVRRSDAGRCRVRTSTGLAGDRRCRRAVEDRRAAANWPPATTRLGGDATRARSRPRARRHRDRGAGPAGRDHRGVPAARDRRRGTGPRDAGRGASWANERVAHALHDTVAQSLVSAHRFLEAARASMAAGRPDAATQQLEAAQAAVLEAIAELRTGDRRPRGTG